MYFTLCKTRTVIVLVTEILIFSSCARKATSSAVLKTSLIAPIDQARLSYEQGEYYKARMQVQGVLNHDPENTVAQQLMGDVLDKEIARQKDAVLVGSLSDEHDGKGEKPNDVNRTDIKTWIERSKTLLSQKQYDLALFAAEKVFVYDADNREASLLIDDIKDEAIKNGKAETLFLSKMYKEEIGERVKKYRSEAQEMVHESKDEQAKFTLQKILMLEPEDPEALRLFRDLQKKEARK